MGNLKIKANLRSYTLKIANSKNLIGKEVELTIKEIVKNKTNKNWKHSASVDLKGITDKIDLQDLAYE